MITTIVLLGAGFVIACIVAVRYAPWFKKTSTEVNTDVGNVIADVKGDVSKDSKAS